MIGVQVKLGFKKTLILFCVVCALEVALGFLVSEYLPFLVGPINAALLAAVIIATMGELLGAARSKLERITRIFIYLGIVVSVALLYSSINRVYPPTSFTELMDIVGNPDRILFFIVELVAVGVALVVELLIWVFEGRHTPKSTSQNESNAPRSIGDSVLSVEAAADVPADAAQHYSAAVLPVAKDEKDEPSTRAIGRPAAFCAALVMAGCLWLSANGLQPLVANSSDISSLETVKNVITLLTAASIMALAVVSIFLALWFMLASMARAVKTLLKTNMEETIRSAGLFVVSIVICLVVGAFLYTQSDQLNTQKLIELFGGYDFLAVPVALAIGVTCVAVFVRFVYTILHATVHHKDVMEAAAKGLARTILLWICGSLKALINVLQGVPDYFSIVSSDLRDSRIEAWRKEIEDENRSGGNRER